MCFEQKENAPWTGVSSTESHMVSWVTTLPSELPAFNACKLYYTVRVSCRCLIMVVSLQKHTFICYWERSAAQNSCYVALNDNFICQVCSTETLSVTSTLTFCLIIVVSSICEQCAVMILSTLGAQLYFGTVQISLDRTLLSDQRSYSKTLHTLWLLSRVERMRLLWKMDDRGMYK